MRCSEHTWESDVCTYEWIYIIQKAFDAVSYDIPVDNYMLKASNRNTKTRCEICSKLTIKTPERHQNDAIGIVLVSLLLTLNIFHISSSVSIVNFEQVNVHCDPYPKTDLLWCKRHSQWVVLFINRTQLVHPVSVTRWELLDWLG